MMGVGIKYPWSSSTAISTFMPGHVLDYGDKALAYIRVIGCCSDSSVFALVPTRLYLSPCIFGMQNKGKVLSRSLGSTRLIEVLQRNELSSRMSELKTRGNLVGLP